MKLFGLLSEWPWGIAPIWFALLVPLCLSWPRVCLHLCAMVLWVVGAAGLVSFGVLGALAWARGYINNPDNRRFLFPPEMLSEERLDACIALPALPSDGLLNEIDVLIKVIGVVLFLLVSCGAGRYVARAILREQGNQQAAEIRAEDERKAKGVKPPFE